MAREEDTGKSQQEHRERAWELAEKIRYCMLVTWDGKKQAARAMDSTVRKDAGVIYFLTDKAGKKVSQIRKFPVVTLSYADTSGFKFVTMSGEASISNDRALIHDLWSSSNKAWWDSPDDPDIRVVMFRPSEAEIWDSPNLLVSTVLMFSAAIMGTKPKVGDHAKVAMPAAGAASPSTPQRASSKSASGASRAKVATSSSSKKAAKASSPAGKSAPAKKSAKPASTKKSPAASKK